MAEYNMYVTLLKPQGQCEFEPHGNERSYRGVPHRQLFPPCGEDEIAPWAKMIVINVNVLYNVVEIDVLFLSPPNPGLLCVHLPTTILQRGRELPNI